MPIINVNKVAEKHYTLKIKDPSSSLEAELNGKYLTEAAARDSRDKVQQVLWDRGRDSIATRKSKSGKKYFKIKPKGKKMPTITSTECGDDQDIENMIDWIITKGQ